MPRLRLTSQSKRCLLILIILLVVAWLIPVDNNLPINGALKVFYTHDQTGQQEQYYYEFFQYTQRGNLDFNLPFLFTHHISQLRLKIKPGYFDAFELVQIALLDQQKTQLAQVTELVAAEDWKISGVSSSKALPTGGLWLQSKFGQENIKLTSPPTQVHNAQSARLVLKFPERVSLLFYVMVQVFLNYVWLPLLILLGGIGVVLCLRLAPPFEESTSRPLAEPFPGVKRFNHWAVWFFAAITLLWACYFCYNWWFIPLYADILWHFHRLLDMPWIGAFTDYIWTDSHYTPFFQLYLKFLIQFPPYGQTPHLLHYIMLGFSGWLLFRYLGKMGVDPWLRWLALLMVLTMPTNKQALYWSAAQHVWHASMLICGVFLLLPKKGQPWTVAKVGLISLLLWLSMNIIELVYGFVGFAMLYWFVNNLKHRKVTLAFVVVGCLLVATILLRNHIVNGDILQLSNYEEVEREYRFLDFKNNFYQILKYAHPLTLADQYLPQGYLLKSEEYTNLGLIALLALYLLQWGSLFWLRHEHRWEWLLFAFSSPLMILLGKGIIEERYLFFTIIANSMVLAILLQHFLKRIRLWQLAFITTTISLILLVNTLANIRIIREHYITDITQHATLLNLLRSEPRPPIGFVDTHPYFMHRLPKDEYHSAAYNDLFSLQRTLDYHRKNPCFYLLSHQVPPRPDQGEDRKGLEVLTQRCDWIPKRMTCYQYERTGEYSGQLKPYHGPAKFAISYAKLGIDPNQLSVQCE